MIKLKIGLNEKLNTPGIFEHTVPPGRYLLEVRKKNYETIRKFIDLEKEELNNEENKKEENDKVNNDVNKEEENENLNNESIKNEEQNTN